MEQITMIVIIFTVRFTLFLIIAIFTAQPKTWNNKDKNRTKNINIQNMKITMTIIMKSTKVS